MNIQFLPCFKHVLTIKYIQSDNGDAVVRSI